jgi:hypothetical protein
VGSCLAGGDKEIFNNLEGSFTRCNW